MSSFNISRPNDAMDPQATHSNVYVAFCFTNLCYAANESHATDIASTVQVVNRCSQNKQRYGQVQAPIIPDVLFCRQTSQETTLADWVTDPCGHPTQHTCCKRCHATCLAKSVPELKHLSRRWSPILKPPRSVDALRFFTVCASMKVPEHVCSSV